jgi:hypothetical protein
MGAARQVAAFVVAAALCLGIAALSQWPTRTEPGPAVVRLSWRTEPVRVEACRTLTPEELEGVPAHMRRTEECAGDFADYELRLRVDGEGVRVDTISPSGLRADRPVYVLVDAPVEPGRHEVHVRFTALVPADVEAETPPALEWRGPMTLGADEIGLLTTTPDGTALRTVRSER